MEGFELEDSDGSSQESIVLESWVSGFCSMVGHEYFCEVSEEFIDDDFNLTGLASLVPHYREALELIADLEPEEPLKLPSIPLIEQSAELLYGLIHARYIISRQGLQDMAKKYEYQHFGLCPRYYCEGTALLPIGRHDLPGFETVRLYCPCCMDIYIPPNSRYMNIDGAFFGTSFASLFLKTFPEIEESCKRMRQNQFELKIYGFKISDWSRSGPRMKWLRQYPSDPKQLDEVEGERGEETDQPDKKTENDDESMRSINMNGEGNT